jgi:hypothetical protein
MQPTPNNTDGLPRETSGMPRETSGMSSELRSDAEQLGTSASNRVHSELDARKGSAAEQAKSVSSAINRAADELDEGVPQWLKSAFQQGAQQVQRFADTLEQKDSRQIMSDIQTMARNNPGTFLASCAALGFAAARIFKAGAPEGAQGQSQQTQFPPVQVEEPMFRPTVGDVAPSANRTGEFA